MITVFVYGTLLVGESNHSVVSPYLLQVQPGVIHGRLYDAGPYPALVRTDDHHVIGEWLTVTVEGLAAMDVLEEYYGPDHPDNDYERIWVKDVNGLQEGWVYSWTSSRGRQEIKESSWKVHQRRKEM